MRITKTRYQRKKHMKLVRTEDAVGCVLCHDITRIIKGVTKDAVFRKGHIVRQEDIPVLLSVGRATKIPCMKTTRRRYSGIYVWGKICTPRSPKRAR